MELQAREQYEVQQKARQRQTIDARRRQYVPRAWYAVPTALKKVALLRPAGEGARRCHFQKNTTKQSV